MTVKKEKVSSGLSRIPFTLLVCTCLIVAQASAQNCIVFGTYSSLPTVSYSCAFGSVSFNYSEWTFKNLGGGNIRITGSPSGSTPALVGILNCNDSTFSAGVTISAGCTEMDSLKGKFTSDTSWNGTFKVTFSGSSCFDCTNQTILVSGTTNHAIVGIPLISGWNMVSNPITRITHTDSVRQLFPNSVFPHVFSFSPGSGYQQDFVLENGPGFWGKFPGPETNNIIGENLTRDSITVMAGWNLIGSISLPTPSDSIIQIPPGIISSSFFGYSGFYAAADTLRPGKAYFVKTSQSGQLILR